MRHAKSKLKHSEPGGTGRNLSPLITCALTAAVVLLVIIVRIRLLGMPLERDEGEFAYIGQLILKGIPPYKLAYSMKLPGIYAVYGLIMAVFGRTAVGIHIGLLLANLTATALVFFIGRRLWSLQAGLIAAASYSMLSLGEPVMGMAAHATQFLTPAVLGAILLALRAEERRKPVLLLWSGLLFGMAIMIKQHALLFAAFAGCYLLWEWIRSRSYSVPQIIGRAGLLAVGVVLPFAVTCLLMHKAGVFGKFWFWTFTYAHSYVSEVPFAAGMQLLDFSGKPILFHSAFFLGLSAIGLIALGTDRKLRQHALFVIGLLVFSLLAVCPGLYFREHYWVQVIPAVSLLAGLGATWISTLPHGRRWLNALPLLVFVGAIAHSINCDRAVFFVSTPVEASRIVYVANPFPESVEVARYIKEHTDPNDRIVVLGSEPQIYFYADRISATGHIYMYGLMEEQPYALRMQEEMIREVEAAQPKYLVHVAIGTSWLPKAGSETLLADWASAYSTNYYKLAGVAEISSTGDTSYAWDEDLRSYVPQSQYRILIFERKVSQP